GAGDRIDCRRQVSNGDTGGGVAGAGVIVGDRDGDGVGILRRAGGGVVEVLGAGGEGPGAVAPVGEVGGGQRGRAFRGLAAPAAAPGDDDGVGVQRARVVERPGPLVGVVLVDRGRPAQAGDRRRHVVHDDRGAAGADAGVVVGDRDGDGVGILRGAGGV